MAHSDAASDPPIVVLHVDDDEADAFAVRRALGRTGRTHRYHHLESGEALLAVLGDGSGDGSGYGSGGEPVPPTSPLIVLLDLAMPGLGGLETLRRLRADDRVPPVPVIVLSGSDDGREVAACYAAGASAYVTKPATADGLQGAARALADHWLATVTLPSTLPSG